MTRRERFLLRRAKYRRQRRRYWSQKYRSPPRQIVNHHGGGVFWLIKGSGKQRPCDVSSASFDATPHPLIGPPLLAFTVSDAGFARPPHVHVTTPFYRMKLDAGWKATYPIVDYHAKRRLYAGHKLFRMNGAARRVMGATWFALNEGCYPDWDPLHRHPTQNDLDNGAPPVDLEWRWGVTGVYPP